MGKRVAVIDGHPDASGTHLVNALAQTYADAAANAGHEVHRISVGSLEFPLVRTQREYSEGIPPAGISRAQETIAWAEHLALFYPLWQGDVPAALKGFLEQTLRPGFAFAFAEKGFPKGLLQGKSARLVVTMGMPAAAYRWYFGAHSLKNLKHGILKPCGIWPVRDTLIGRVESANAATRTQWFSRAARLGEAAI